MPTPSTQSHRLVAENMEGQDAVFDAEWDNESHPTYQSQGMMSTTPDVQGFPPPSISQPNLRQLVPSLDLSNLPGLIDHIQNIREITTIPEPQLNDPNQNIRQSTTIADLTSFNHPQNSPYPIPPSNPEKFLLWKFVSNLPKDRPSPFKTEIFVECPTRRRPLVERPVTTEEVPNVNGTLSRWVQSGLIYDKPPKHGWHCVTSGSAALVERSPYDESEPKSNVENICSVWTLKYRADLGTMTTTAWTYHAAACIDMAGTKWEYMCQVPLKPFEVEGVKYDLEPGWEEVVDALCLHGLQENSFQYPGTMRRGSPPKQSRQPSKSTPVSPKRSLEGKAHWRSPERRNVPSPHVHSPVNGSLPPNAFNSYDRQMFQTAQVRPESPAFGILKRVGAPDVGVAPDPYAHLHKGHGMLVLPQEVSTQSDDPSENIPAAEVHSNNLTEAQSANNLISDPEPQVHSYPPIEDQRNNGPDNVPISNVHPPALAEGQPPMIEDTPQNLPKSQGNPETPAEDQTNDDTNNVPTSQVHSNLPLSKVATKSAMTKQSTAEKVVQQCAREASTSAENAIPGPKRVRPPKRKASGGSHAPAKKLDRRSSGVPPSIKRGSERATKADEDDGLQSNHAVANTPLGEDNKDRETPNTPASQAKGVNNLDYLKPDFNLESLRIKDLREILGSHQIQVPKHRKKSELVKLVTERVILSNTEEGGAFAEAKPSDDSPAKGATTTKTKAKNDQSHMKPSAKTFGTKAPENKNLCEKPSSKKTPQKGNQPTSKSLENTRFEEDADNARDGVKFSDNVPPESGFSGPAVSHKPSTPSYMKPVFFKDQFRPDGGATGKFNQLFMPLYMSSAANNSGQVPNVLHAANSVSSMISRIGKWPTETQKKVIDQQQIAMINKIGQKIDDEYRNFLLDQINELGKYRATLPESHVEELDGSLPNSQPSMQQHNSGFLQSYQSDQMSSSTWNNNRAPSTQQNSGFQSEDLLQMISTQPTAGSPDDDSFDMYSVQHKNDRSRSQSASRQLPSMQQNNHPRRNSFQASAMPQHDRSRSRSGSFQMPSMQQNSGSARGSSTRSSIPQNISSPNDPFQMSALPEDDNPFDNNVPARPTRFNNKLNQQFPRSQPSNRYQTPMMSFTEESRAEAGLGSFYEANNLHDEERLYQNGANMSNPTTTTGVSNPNNQSQQLMSDSLPGSDSTAQWTHTGYSHADIDHARRQVISMTQIPPAQHQSELQQRLEELRRRQGSNPRFQEQDDSEMDDLGDM